MHMLALRLLCKTRRFRRTDSVAPAVYLAIVASLAGCQSANFRAGQLPAQYQAVGKTPRNTLNLSRLSASNGGNAQISAGDLLEVTVATGRAGENPEPQLARVAGDGSVDLPLVGRVLVAHSEPFEAGQRIAAAAVERGIYRRPHVTIDFKSRATNKITVLGAVKEPGTYELPRSACDLAAAIGAAGGMTEEAGTEVEVLSSGSTFLAHDEGAPSNGAALVGLPQPEATSGGIQLANFERPGVPQNGMPAGRRATQTLRIDLAMAVHGAEPVRSLGDHDVVMVLPRDEEVIHVGGLVQKPGQFELPADQDLYLLDAVELAGGVRSPLADRILIIRRLPDQPPLSIRASIADAKKRESENIRIAAGDMVSVERTPATVFFDTFSNLFRISLGMTSRSTLF